MKGNNFIGQMREENLYLTQWVSYMLRTFFFNATRFDTLFETWSSIIVYLIFATTIRNVKVRVLP